MTLCPCGSRKPLEACCAPLLAGAPAPTAEALMRSRYTAYVQGDLAHLERTLAAPIRGEFEAEETARTAAEARWQGLEIRAVTGGGEGDDTGTVEFTVRFRLRGQTHVQHERATFAREEGRWVYTGGEDNPKEPPRQAAKVGRNDPCPCGSGKKFKKCCGAA